MPVLSRLRQLPFLRLSLRQSLRSRHFHFSRRARDAKEVPSDTLPGSVEQYGGVGKRDWSKLGYQPETVLYERNTDLVYLGLIYFWIMGIPLTGVYLATSVFQYYNEPNPDRPGEFRLASKAKRLALALGVGGVTCFALRPSTPRRPHRTQRCPPTATASNSAPKILPSRLPRRPHRDLPSEPRQASETALSNLSVLPQPAVSEDGQGVEGTTVEGLEADEGAGQMGKVVLDRWEGFGFGWRLVFGNFSLVGR
ncbi:hypothetical protein BT69DRAFT_55045 [Atractiella rhizophila]|nr:hypothetical protein BT69DRAFT_55045 [Atractiella rhizophila]